LRDGWACTALTAGTRCRRSCSHFEPTHYPALVSGMTVYIGSIGTTMVGPFWHLSCLLPKRIWRPFLGGSERRRGGPAEWAVPSRQVRVALRNSVLSSSPRYRLKAGYGSKPPSLVGMAKRAMRRSAGIRAPPSAVPQSASAFHRSFQEAKTPETYFGRPHRGYVKCQSMNEALSP